MSDPGFTSHSLYEEEPGPSSRQPSSHPRRRLRHRGTKLHAFLDFLKRKWRPENRRKFLLQIAGGGFGFGVLYLLFLWITLPNINDPGTLFAQQSTAILDRNGTELYRLYNEEDRTFIPKEQIPKHMRDAIVAIEDERFYDRGCLDVQALARVVFRFGQAGGASTLTRQLARNALDLQRDNIVNRKLKEIILGCQLEARYDKDELLSMYLNWIPFGQNAYGVELASRTYFDTSAKDLTLAQSAIMAALPQAPSYYSPYGRHVRTTVSQDVLDDIARGRITSSDAVSDDDVAIGLLGQYVGTGANTVYIGGRTDQVLSNMEKLGMITKAEKNDALKTLATIEFKKYREDIRAPHFVLWIREQLQELLGNADEGVLEQGGLTVTTTLSWEMQQMAEKAVTRLAPTNASLYGAHNAALVSADPRTGEILSYVGNVDYNDEEHEGKIDMARVPRQPGSTFKPFVYALAFEQGYGPGSAIYDVATKVGDDAPQNFDGGYEGLMSMRTALAHSRNVPAAKAFFLAGGEDAVLAFVDSLGVPTPRREKEKFQQKNPDSGYGWPLAIGAAETPLLEMVQGYATIASGGERHPLVSILSVTDRQGNILYRHEPEEPAQVLDARIAALITSILSDREARPANEYWRSVLTVPGTQAAAKTGTSNKCLERNAQGGCTKRRPEGTWTIGYTPSLVTGVWVGNATSEALGESAESLVTASPIWKEFMTGAHGEVEHPVTAFTLPSGLAQPQISTLSGKLPNECTPVDRRRSDFFLEERVPTESDPACVKLEVDKVTGLLASPACPADAAEERAFFLPSSELPTRWPLWEQAVQTWAKEEMATWSPDAGTGSSLPLPLAPAEVCDPALTPGRDETPIVQILTPDDGETVSYPAFEPEIRIQALAKITEVRFEVDGRPIRTVTEEPWNVSLRVPRTIDEAGTHTLTVTIVNEYFTQASDEAKFRFGDAPAREERIQGEEGLIEENE